MDGHEYYFVDDDDDDEYETRNRINIEKRWIEAKFPLESCNATWIPWTCKVFFFACIQTQVYFAQKMSNNKLEFICLPR